MSNNLGGEILLIWVIFKNSQFKNVDSLIYIIGTSGPPWMTVNVTSIPNQSGFVQSELAAVSAYH